MKNDKPEELHDTHPKTEDSGQQPISKVDADYEAIKRIFELTLEMRNFEITQLTHRNNFFMIFQGVLLAGVVQSTHMLPVVSFLVCMAGFSVSIYQVAMAGGAKFWQEYWEAALEKTEELLIHRIIRRAPDTHISRRTVAYRLFHDDTTAYEKIVRERLNKHNAGGTVSKIIMQRFSVSRIPIYVGVCLSLIWFLLVLCTMRGYAPLGIPSFIVGFSK